jgi:hypothetical protein
MPSVSVEELFAFLFPLNLPRENRRAFVIYGTYYDESDEKPGFSVAGYSAPYETWVHLDWKWQCLLKKWKLAYFKASECENLLGEFAQYRDNPTDLASPLKANERDKLIEIKTEFVDAICKHGDDLHGYGAVVILDDFEKIISEDAEAKRIFMDKPYYICLQLCLVAAAMPARDHNLQHPNREEHVYIKPIFDSHKDYSDLAKLTFDKFLKKNPRSAEVLLPLDYEDDKLVSALQVADNLAYEARKHLTRQIVKGDDYIRKPMERFRPFIYRIYRLDYQALKLIVARQDPDYIPISPVKVNELW